MAATAIYANRKGFSKTNLPNSWISRPKTGKKKDSKIHSIADLFPSDRPGYRAACRAFTDEDRQTFYTDLQGLNTFCPLTWISSPEPEKIEDPIAPPLVEDLLPLLFKNKNEFIEKIKVTKEQRLFVSETTKTQRKCQLWGQFRRLRLTGSNFGLVLGAIRRKIQKGHEYPPSLFKALKGGYNYVLDRIHLLLLQFPP